METIYLGAAGGTTLRSLAAGIADVLAVRAARISIDHSRGRRRIRADDYVEVVERAPFVTDEVISCGIPGHEHPGEEVVAEVLAVRDDALEFEGRGAAASPRGTTTAPTTEAGTAEASPGWDFPTRTGRSLVQRCGCSVGTQRESCVPPVPGGPNAVPSGRRLRRRPPPRLVLQVDDDSSPVRPTGTSW